MKIDFDQMVMHLRKLRAEHGDESFHNALKGLFRSLLDKPGGEDYIRRLLAEFGSSENLDDLKAEARKATTRAAQAPAGSPANVVLDAIKQEMPNCKTQAHFDLVVQSWDALRLYLNAAYGRDRETADQARAALIQLLDLAPRMAELHSRIQDAPEATTNRDYIDEPKELTEHHKQQTLLAELADIDNIDRLNTWYVSAKPVLDSIVSQQLRNQIFDAIRSKKHTLIN